MITVTIAINGETIFKRSATNESVRSCSGETKYLSDCGTVIWHKRADGAIALAKKMVALLRESDRKGKRPVDVMWKQEDALGPEQSHAPRVEEIIGSSLTDIHHCSEP